MFHRFFVFLSNAKGRFSRSEWAMWLLRLPPAPPRPDREHGLILIQIDGLSHEEYLKAIDAGELPFLKRLIDKEHYRVRPIYSGVPSSTPAAQGEFFYGVKSCVPAFSFIERKTKKTRRMYDVEAAKRVEARLMARGEALLEGGSSYSNIFSGGAQESHFCSTNFGWREMLRMGPPPHLGLLALLYLDVYLRTIFLMAVEAALAVLDFFRDTLRGRNFWSELQFIPTRVAICVLLREWVTVGVQIDAVRGLAVIHANFLGYDEQAHHRGPSSAFAHWSLRGIDDAIFRIWKKAQASRKCRYDLWVYSDHGQEAVIPYSKAIGRDIRGAILSLLDGARITSMGPLGHVYPARKMVPEEKERAAGQLARDKGIPWVFTKDERGKIAAWNRDKKFELPAQAAEVFGSAHPYLNEVTKDLMTVCRHPDAGEFVLCGWRSDGPPLSFQTESGAHGGPGSRETSAFALLPRDAPMPEASLLRPLHLREAALRFLGRRPSAVSVWRQPRAGFRLMTYNVHSCVGMDGRLSPERVARIIAHHSPDVVALQELDVHCTRSGCVDQARRIAEKLEMQFHFHPSFHIEDGSFGNAVLSRFPMQILRVGELPRVASLKAEPRGAISVMIDIPGRPMRLVNTHLSVWPRERVLQARALRKEWLDPDFTPFILCGDFNAMPGSLTYRLLGQGLTDAQKGNRSQKPRRTWSGHYPLARIDHIFLDGGLRVLGSEVPATSLECAASDHLPLLVDLAIGPAVEEALLR